MKRANNLLPLIEDMDNLRLAFWKAGKGKRHAAAVLAYQENLEENLRELQRQIQAGSVAVGDYRYFLIHEPKEREICAGAFREQVLHHALMNVCHAYFDKKLIHDCYASRKGKGTYAALERAKDYTRKYSWYLKLDVRKFFASIHHDVLKGQLAAMFKEERLLRIFFQIIDSFEASPGRGVPIGNLTSQYFANHYLSGLDHYIKERLGIEAYVRYMDDMVLWHDDKMVLKAVDKVVTAYLENCLQLELKPIQLNSSEQGLPFLGYRLFAHYGRLLQKSKQRYIRKLNQTIESWHEYRLDDAGAAARILPLVAFTGHVQALHFRKGVLSR
jgi:RNA-directed DNA polymerase